MSGLGTRIVSGSRRGPLPARGTMTFTYTLTQRALDQRVALLDPQHDLALQHVDRLVLLVVVLQTQDVAGLDVEDLADVAVGLRPDELVAPGLLDAIGKVAHGNLGLRIAECGVRSLNGKSPAPGFRP